MSDHDDLLAEADATRALFEDVMGPSDATELLGRLAAALRAVTAERDADAATIIRLGELIERMEADHRGALDKIADLAAALRAVEAERDALRRIVRRFGPPPGGLLLDPDEADALRNAFADQETTQ